MKFQDWSSSMKHEPVRDTKAAEVKRIKVRKAKISVCKFRNVSHPRVKSQSVT